MSIVIMLVMMVTVVVVVMEMMVVVVIMMVMVMVVVVVVLLEENRQGNILYMAIDESDHMSYLRSENMYQIHLIVIVLHELRLFCTD